MDSEQHTSSDDSDGEESLSEDEVEEDGSTEMILVPKKTATMLYS